MSSEHNSRSLRSANFPGPGPRRRNLHGHDDRIVYAQHSEALASCLDRVLAALRDANPEIGRTVAIDGSDKP